MTKATIALACAAALGFVPSGAALGQPTAAQATTGSGIEDPVAYVRAGYAAAPAASDEEAVRRAREEVPESQNPDYTPRLRALFADNERYANGEIGRLEFNFWTGAQDDDIGNVAVEAHDVDGAPDRKVVSARFDNIGQPTAINFFFERIDGRWHLDDVSSPGSGTADGMGPWTLSLILRYGHS